MTTSILDALIQLFALFAAGRGEEGVALGRDHAARYMRNQLPKPLVDDSLLRFDMLVEQFQKLPSQGADVHAKRLAKLSVKLLRTCSLHGDARCETKRIARMCSFLGRKV